MVNSQRSRHVSRTTLLFHVCLPTFLGPPLSTTVCNQWQPKRAKPRKSATKPADITNKKPYGHWTHLPNVLSELEMYMSELSPRPDAMPTARELSRAGREDLAGAIRRLSWRKVAAAAKLPLSSQARPRSLNLSFCTQIRSMKMRPYMYWRDWNNLEAELREFLRVHGRQTRDDVKEEFIMPTVAELIQHERSDLKRAISLHGGVREVAKRMGLAPSSRPISYWTEKLVIQEVRRVMLCTGNTKAFPKIAELRQFGERGLPSAVRRLGGARILTKRMGLAKKKRLSNT